MKAKKATKKMIMPEVRESVKYDADTTSTKKNPTFIVIGILAAIILLILAVNKGYVVTAIVEGKPIFRWQFVNTLVSRYGKQTLETMISEALIDKEAKSTGVSVSQADIDQKEGEILKSFGGNVTLDEVLQYQGMTKSDFDSQVRLQLVVTKILSKDITVTDADITAYIEKNKTSMTASDEAALKIEARSILTDQKISEKVQPWFTELKTKAKILRFQ